MNGHDFTVAVYVVIALVGVGLQLRSHKEGSRIPPLSQVFGQVMRTRSGRVGVVVGWAWLGLHFYAR